MVTKSPSAVEHAVRVILGHINRGEWGESGILPGIKSLSKLSGVSYVSAWKALQTLREKGVIMGFAGRRFNIVSKSRPQNVDRQKPINKRAKRWELLKKELARDIINGVFPLDKPLPMIKELEDKYGVSYTTLKRALTGLCNESVIRGYKKTYRIIRLVPKESYSRIVLFCLGDFVEQITVGRFRGEEFLLEVVRECSRRRIVLDIAIHSVKDNEYFFFRKSEKQKLTFSSDEDALGYLIQTPGCEMPKAFVEHAVRLGKPVAILDETGTGHPVFPGKKPVPIVTFNTGFDTGPGEEIGRFLLQLGHRHIAFISPFHGSKWSVNRYEGLCKAFASVGFESGVSAFTINDFGYQVQYEEALIAGGRLTGLLDICDRVENTFASRADYCADQLRETVKSKLAFEEIRSRMIPLFENIFSDPSITAWVGCNDFVALAAIHFLRVTKRVPVPRSISVAGFDNTLGSFISDLTTYDFNIPSAVRAMIDFVVKPKRNAQQEPTSSKRIEGMLVQRGSTGRAART